MTVRVRLQRFGRRNRPFYRVVVADSRSPRDGKFIELVGTYNPLATRSGMKEVTFKVDRIRYWISVGAQPSDRVAWLLGQFGILPPKVVPVARTERILPRKERKELKKQRAGAKGFHTSACSGALQPSYCGGGDPVGGTFLQTVLADRDGDQVDRIATQLAQEGCLNTGNEFEASLLDTGRLFFGWGTGAEKAAGTTCHDHHHREGSSKNATGVTTIGLQKHGEGVASGLFQLSLTGGGWAEQQSRWAASSSSPLRAVLASHLSLLGPSAFSLIGLRLHVEDSARAAR